MPLPDFTEATIWTRLMAATLTFVVLAGSAAAVVVFAMMLVLFSTDGASGSQFNNVSLSRAVWGVALSLSVAVVLPPLMLLFKASPVHSLVPAGVGFVLAGLVTLWFVIMNVGGQTGG
ncbi:MAG: hypothetical protein AAGJ40_11415 [Planctomycetota bacterium]